LKRDNEKMEKRKEEGEIERKRKRDMKQCKEDNF
jgi:hypothetical protein